MATSVVILIKLVLTIFCMKRDLFLSMVILLSGHVSFCNSFSCMTRFHCFHTAKLMLGRISLLKPEIKTNQLKFNLKKYKIEKT